MEVIYWQLFVAGTTAAAYFFGSRMLSAAVAGLWTLWTLAMLSYSPLVILQLVSAWGTFRAVDVFTKQSRELTAFKEALVGFREEDKQALVEAKDEGRFSLLSDSSHYDYMLRQIERANSSVMILSGWISDKVIDVRFIETLSNALKRGVKIYIGFGYENSNGVHEVSRPAKRALTSLKKLSENHSGISVGIFNNHQKALVIDKRRVVCGSHNWLSNRTFKNREQSFIIDDSKAAEAVFLHSVPMIESNIAF
ncbi:MAG: hypothetical protein GYB30_01890 [Gammaproteobacteria bacterium]|nr:hypothetical protein [Gammaproteobacteria bacterium]